MWCSLPPFLIVHPRFPLAFYSYWRFRARSWTRHRRRLPKSFSIVCSLARRTFLFLPTRCHHIGRPDSLTSIRFPSRPTSHQYKPLHLPRSRRKDNSPTPIDSDSFDVTLAHASPTILLEVTSQVPSAERMLYRVPGRLDSDWQEASSVHKVSSMLVLPFSRVTLVSTVESWFPSFHLCIQSRRAYGFSFHTSHRLADPLHLPAQVWRKMEDISNRQNSTLLPGNALDSTQPL
jgi:hypothetical protein